jgi:predicted glycosyltransferase involved in capsule biosynthesis
LNISFIIPWRSDHGHRERAFNWLLLRLGELYPEAEVLFFDASDEDGTFNRGAARNKGWHDSHGNIVIFLDADTFVPDICLRAAITEVEHFGHPYAFPYTHYYSLTEKCTENFLTQPPQSEITNPEFEFEFPSPATPEQAVSGCIVMWHSTFIGIGGYDERFKGWGLEDRVFAMQLQRRFGTQPRVNGPIYHLWHPTVENERFGQPNFEHNRRLYHEYCDLLGFQPIC